jgi:mannose-6-phosphate isomerase-like protein (cupin superfamily)
MKLTDKLAHKIVRLDSDEKYTRLFNTKNNTALSCCSGCVVLKEGESIGEHSTKNAEEILIILYGKGELFIEKFEKLNFEKNVAIYIPPNTIHDIKNRGGGILKYIFFTCPVIER